MATSTAVSLGMQGNMDHSLRETVQKELQQRRLELQKVVWEQQAQLQASSSSKSHHRSSHPSSSSSSSSAAAAATMSSSSSSSLSNTASMALPWPVPAVDEASSCTVQMQDAVLVDVAASVRAKEQEIERRKSQVQGKVKAHLSRLESQGRRLDQLRRELEGLEDPTKKEVAEVRKKIEIVDRDLKPLKQLCERKEKELKEATQSFNEKNKLKNELVAHLMEIVANSERQRLQKLDELNKQLEAMELYKKLDI